MHLCSAGGILVCGSPWEEQSPADSLVCKDKASVFSSRNSPEIVPASACPQGNR